MELRYLENETLLVNLKSLCQNERRLHGLCLRYLAEVDRRLLFAEKGYSSLFAFVVSELGLSEHSALKRIALARAALKFPQILALLESGHVSMTALMKLSPHMTRGNCDRLLRACEGKSVREVETVLAAEFPKPEPADSTKPLAGNRIHYSFCADEEFDTMLKLAKAELSHRYPDGRLRDILKEALGSFLCAVKDKRVSKMPRPAEKRTRHVPKSVKEIVWERDGGRCSFVSEDGRRCDSRHFLEWDHCMPWTLGGSSTDPENIRLLCRSHNRLMASDTFGIEYIEKKMAQRTGAKVPVRHRNQFLLDIWAAGGLKRYKKLLGAELPVKSEASRQPLASLNPHADMPRG